MPVWFPVKRLVFLFFQGPRHETSIGSPPHLHRSALVPYSTKLSMCISAFFLIQRPLFLGPRKMEAFGPFCRWHIATQTKLFSSPWILTFKEDPLLVEVRFANFFDSDANSPQFPLHLPPRSVGELYLFPPYILRNERPLVDFPFTFVFPPRR